MTAAKVVVFLVLLPLVAVASLAAAFIGLGWIAGPDIGFAGGGLILLITPPAAVALVIAASLSYLVLRARPLAVRHTMFALLATTLSFGLGGLLAGYFKGWHRGPTEPESVWVQGQSTLEVSAPAEAWTGDAIEVSCLERPGTWSEVPYAEARASGRTDWLTSPPSPETAPAGGPSQPHVSLQSDPPADGHWDNLSGGCDREGRAVAVFGRPGVYALWAGQPWDQGQKSNVLTITVSHRDPLVPIVPNTRADGRAFGARTIQAVWEKAKAIEGFDRDQTRYSACYEPIRFVDYGNARSDHGWVIDHVRPVAKGGTDALDNLQPLHWEVALRKSDAHPWTCVLGVSR